MYTIKKPYHPMYIANYIITFCTENGYEINNLKLQKIMYYLQAQSLVESSLPLFDENLQKWKYGPVVPTVYHEYKSHGASSIKTEDIGKIIRTPYEGETPNFINTYIVEEYTSDKINNDDKYILDETVPVFAGYDSFYLVEQTHKHDIWRKDAPNILLGLQGIEYSNEEIKNYFESHYEEQLWKR